MSNVLSLFKHGIWAMFYPGISWYPILFCWIRIRIVFARIRIRIKVRPGSGSVTNFFTSWIRIRINMIRIRHTGCPFRRPSPKGGSTQVSSLNLTMCFVVGKSPLSLFYAWMTFAPAQMAISPQNDYVRIYRCWHTSSVAEPEKSIFGSGALNIHFWIL